MNVRARGILINSYDDDENQQYYFLNGCPTVIQANCVRVSSCHQTKVKSRQKGYQYHSTSNLLVSS